MRVEVQPHSPVGYFPPFKGHIDVRSSPHGVAESGHVALVRQKEIVHNCEVSEVVAQGVTPRGPPLFVFGVEVACWYDVPLGCECARRSNSNLWSRFEKVSGSYVWLK